MILRKQMLPDSPPCKKVCIGNGASAGQRNSPKQERVDEKGSVHLLQKEGVTDQSTKPFFDVILRSFPRNPLDISAWIPILQSRPDPPCREAYLVFPEDCPAVTLYVTYKSETEDNDTDRATIEDFGNDVTRELTSVLQGYMTAPLCIVPVFVDRQDRDDLQETVNKKISDVKPFIPYGRFLMTESKFQALQKGAEEIKNHLKTVTEPEEDLASGQASM